MNQNQAYKTENPLAKEFNLVSLLGFALPTMVMMLFMGLYTITDTIFVSRFVNTDALSALNIVCPVVNLMVGFGTMLATGGSAIVARKMGAGQSLRASRDFTLIISAGVCFGLAVAGLGTLFLNPLVRGLGAGRRLFPYCREYLSVLLLFAPAGILQVLFQNLMVTAGRPGMGMVLGISAGLVNILADYVFMVLFPLGIRGAALGTGTGYLVPAVAGLLFFAVGGGSLRFRKPVLDIGLLVRSCSNGCSEMVSQTAAAVTTFLFNRTMMKLLGEDGVAAITIIIYTQFLLTTLHIGFSMGVAPVFSFHYGKQDRLRLRKLFSMCIRFVSAASVLVFAAALVLGAPLVELFSPKGTRVYEIGSQGFRIFSWSFLLCGLNIFTSAVFTALSDGKRSAVLSFLRTFGLILVLLLFLPEFLGVTGVWLAVPVAELVTGVVAVGLWRGIWK